MASKSTLVLLILSKIVSQFHTPSVIFEPNHSSIQPIALKLSGE
jgi:hypothetical protein